jgi:hypothetical protein
MDRVGPPAEIVGGTGINFRRFFVPNTMWTWLLTCELRIMSSLRDSIDKRHPTRHCRAGLKIVASLRDSSVTN